MYIFRVFAPKTCSWDVGAKKAFAPKNIFRTLHRHHRNAIANCAVLRCCDGVVAHPSTFLTKTWNMYFGANTQNMLFGANTWYKRV